MFIHNQEQANKIHSQLLDKTRPEKRKVDSYAEKRAMEKTKLDTEIIALYYKYTGEGFSEQPTKQKISNELDISRDRVNKALRRNR